MRRSSLLAGTVTGGSYEFLVDGITVRPRADSNVYTTTAFGNESSNSKVFDQNTAADPLGCSATLMRSTF